MPTLQPCDETIFTTAPVRFSKTFEIARPAQEVWNALVADGSLSWCRALGGAVWTSPRPFGVGSTRAMRVAGLLQIGEVYFRWEEGRRKSFYIAKSNLPLFERFAEDYLVEAASADACRFTWTLAGKPSPIGAAGAPLLGVLVASFFSDTSKYFAVRS